MINTINLAYYSHSVKTYNSDKEKKEYDFLKKIIKGHVICPNQHIGKLESSEIYQNIIKKVDCVFVSDNEGFIGKGSYNECLNALENNIPVFVIKNKNNNLELEKVTKIIQVSEYNLFQFGKII
ncbi:hypothetical protein [uncultured Flavobacterium sp.]|uniref:hypothetical protein n=1 Tax=uncultured Flavobacterium sp. TaxID=165435 RepID=UPI0030EDF756|tara:strand:- start:626 stop:997 length:372 start_codon:yes stop_codon:yes gene_type:complete